MRTLGWLLLLLCGAGLAACGDNAASLRDTRQCWEDAKKDAKERPIDEWAAHWDGRRCLVQEKTYGLKRFVTLGSPAPQNKANLPDGWEIVLEYPADEGTIKVLDLYAHQYIIDCATKRKASSTDMNAYVMKADCAGLVEKAMSKGSADR